MPMPDFTDRIYVDFSGDDGDPRKAGASKCICMAWVLSKEEDIYYNQGIILSIKKTIGARKDAELKYTSLKRHKYKAKALELLSKARIQLLLVPVLKARLSNEELQNPRNKRLITLIHDFPLNRFLDNFARASYKAYFQLIFDEIGWAGCQEGITQLFKSNSRLDWKNARPDWLRFSKSESNLMLQLADVIAGMGYEYMDGLQEVRLPPCQVCWLKGKSRCRLLPNRNKNLLDIFYPWLLKNNSGLVWETGFVVRPPVACRDYMFVDCLSNPELIRRRSSG